MEEFVAQGVDRLDAGGLDAVREGKLGLLRCGHWRCVCTDGPVFDAGDFQAERAGRRDVLPQQHAIQRPEQAPAAAVRDQQEFRTDEQHQADADKAGDDGDKEQGDGQPGIFPVHDEKARRETAGQHRAQQQQGNVF